LEIMTAAYHLFQGDFSAGRWACWHAPEWKAECLQELLSGIGVVAGREYRLWTAPRGSTAFVKVYNPRPKHSALRRLRHSRAMAEGQGYLAFAEAGIPTPRLLAWGEARKRGFWTQGLVVTEVERSPTVAERFRESQELNVLQRAMQCLVLIHQRGLAHGDARLRNFFIDERRVLAFDLCSWQRLKKTSRRDDLVRFLGSCLTLSEEPVAAELFELYGRAVPIEVERASVLEAAAAYAGIEKEP
jgi:tRNA A-37 threonylcarbamoyl transferase component Bud32